MGAPFLTVRALTGTVWAGVGAVVAAASGLAGCAAAPREDAPAPLPGELAVQGRQLNFGGGVRSFEDDDFTRLEDQTVFTLDYCEVLGLGALRLEGGLHYAYDDSKESFQGQDVRLRSEVFEPSVGVNYSFLLGRLRPYAGLGVAIQFLDLHGIDAEGNREFDDDDLAFGAYLKAGLLLQVTPTSHVGVEYRHLEGGDVTVDGTSLDTGYDQVLILFGTSFFPGPGTDTDRQE